MTIKWSGRTSAHAHKFDGWEEKSIEGVKSGVRKITVLDAQWSACPVEVEYQVKLLWRYYELGNDHYVLKTSIDDLTELGLGFDDELPTVDMYNSETKVREEVPVKTDAIIQYLVEQGVLDDGEEIWIHWWW